MNCRCRLIFFLLFFPVLGLAADESSVLAAAGPRVEITNAGAEWQTLFDKLAAQGAVFSHFTENRWFPFKKIPVVLKGEMRMAPSRGMSLRYMQPENRTIIMDERGLLLRDDRGRSREVPPDPRASNVNAALLPVLRFDQKELEKAFFLRAVRVGNAWRLDFEPRDPALVRMVGQIIVWGEDEKIRLLEFRRSNSQRIEIVIDDSQIGVVFSADELKQFFR